MNSPRHWHCVVSKFVSSLNSKTLASRKKRSSVLNGGDFEFVKLEDRIVLTAGNGLLGQYYSNPDLNDLALVRVDSNVDFDWGSGAYDATGTANQFSVRWSGQIEAQFTETHSLFVNANDGARLWVNGQLLIDQFDNGQVVDALGTIDLIAGRRYDIQLEYRENTGNASVSLEWSSASQSREVIPTDRLYASQRGTILTETWSGISGSSVADLMSDAGFPENPDAVGVLNSLESVSNSGSNFGERIVGQLHAPETGPYTFYLAANDSAELWLSNSSDPSQRQLIASVSSATGPRQWDAVPEQRSGVVYLAAGQRYFIEALHKESTGADHLAVGWTRPGSSAIEVVPGDYLSPTLPTVRIFSDFPNTAEGSATPASFEIIRSGGPINNPLTVSYSVGGDATNGVDYQSLNGTITIPAGADSVNLDVVGLIDAVTESPESLIIELVAAPGYEVGYKSERVSYGKILDDSAAPVGGVSLWNGTQLSDFTRFGGSFSTVNDAVEGNVIQAVVTNPTGNLWSAQMKLAVVAPVAEGDILWVEFKVRSVGGPGLIAGVFEKFSSPYTKSLHQGLQVAEQWSKVQMPFVVTEAYATGEAGIALFLGSATQTLRFTDFQLLNYGQPKTLAPETSLTVANLGGNYGVGQIVPVTGQPFTFAQEVTTTQVPPATWRLQAVERNEGAVANGDTLRFEFSIRATAGANPTAKFLLQRRSDFANLVNQTINATSQWQSFSIDYTVGQDFGVDGLQLAFLLGYSLQTVEIGGVHWTNLDSAVDIEDLPEQFFAPSYGGRGGAEGWREGAEDRISNDRKGDVTINVTDINGQPLSGAVVSLRQNQNAFHFGSAINAYNGKLDTNGTAEALQYQGEIERLFNSVVFENSLKWPGYLSDAQRAIDGVNWADARDLNIRGHNIVWPSRTHMPGSVWAEYDTRVSNDGATSAAAWLKTTIENRFDEMLTQFDGLISDWDVVNEPWSNHDVMDILGNGVMLEWFQRVRDFDPGIKLTLNDYGIFTSDGSNTAHRSNFEGWLGQLRDASLLDIIGVQSHFSDVNLTDIETLGQLINTYQTQFGATIAITEFDVDSPDEQLQADYLRDYMTMAFSQTGVSQFLHWGFWEGAHHSPGSALYRTDFSAKPNGQAYEDLVFGRWWTDIQATTRDGAVTANAFLGEYDVIVEYDGQFYTSTVSVDDSGNSSLTLNVPVSPVNYSPLIASDVANVSGDVLAPLNNSGTWLEPEHEAVSLAASLGNVTQNSDGTWDWSFVSQQRYVNQIVTITATDARGGVAETTFQISADTVVTSRGVTYGGASGFGETEIATDKTALLPGQTATVANYTNYTRGLNRVVIDVAGLASSSLTVDDFEFRVGNSADPSSWALLDANSSIPLPTISILAPIGGVSQIFLAWPNNAIQNTWLQTTVKSTANTGLVSASVFYFGNQIGDVNGDVNAQNKVRVNAFDTLLVRGHQNPVNDTTIDDVYDVDRSGRVNAFDVIRVRANQMVGGLLMFTAPGAVSSSLSPLHQGDDGKAEWACATVSKASREAHQDPPADVSLDHFFSGFGLVRRSVASASDVALVNDHSREETDAERRRRQLSLESVGGVDLVLIGQRHFAPTAGR